MNERTIRVFSQQAARHVDEAAVKRYGMLSILLMENASRNVAEIAQAMLSAAGARSDGRVLIICGRGNNGGDGLAAARHLHNAAIDVTVVAPGAPKAGSDARVNYEICRKMGLDMRPFDGNPWPEADLIIDAIFGTGLDRPVEGDPATAIGRINEADAPVLSVDLPSGLECDTGRPLGIAVRATRTASFLGWKKGFLEDQAKEYIGEVIVAQIGAPRELIEEFGEPMPPSAR